MTTVTISSKVHFSYLPEYVCLPGTILQEASKRANGSTTSGVLLQNGAEQRMTAANHGFPDSQDVYHPDPLGRRIGQITTRQLDWDITLVQLDPLIAFTTARYFDAPSAQRLTPSNELLASDWFEVDGISTGRIDLCARSISQYRSTTEPNSALLDARGWKIEVGFSSFGASGAAVKDGVCGAPIVDRDGRVAGVSRRADPSGLFAFTPALNPLIALWLVCCLILMWSSDMRKSYVVGVRRDFNREN